MNILAGTLAFLRSQIRVIMHF